MTAGSEPRTFLGLDIGGTKLAAGCMTERGELLGWQRASSDAEHGPERMVEQLVDLTRLAVRELPVELAAIEAVGVACGGPLDAEAGIITNALNNPGWVNVPLRRMLEDELQRPVFIENDANAAALGEHLFGAGRGVENMVYVTVSTGIGGGAILGGRLYRGENGNAAEIGHIQIEWDGRRCHCGGRGCLEAYASGTNIARRAREALEREPGSLLLELAGSADGVTAETVAGAARQGDAVAMRVWDETISMLAAGIASVINVFNPRLVVIGGGVTRAGSLFFEPLRAKTVERAMAPLAELVEIVPAQLGDRVGVVGAATVALQRAARDVRDTRSPLPEPVMPR